MPTEHPLLHVTEIDTDIETYLNHIAEITYPFPEHDSRCQSFQVVVDDQRYGTGGISERRTHRRKNKRLYAWTDSLRVACQQ